MKLRRGWGSGLMVLGVLIILASNLALPFLPFDAYFYTNYRGYDIFIVRDDPTNTYYIVEGIGGQFSTVTAAKAKIDEVLGPPVTNHAPVAVASIPGSGTTGKTCYFYGDGSYDPDGDSFSCSWSFGDGGSSSSKNPTHVYSTAKTYTVKLTVSDGKLSDSDSGSITISDPPPPPNQAPSAEANGPYSGTAGASISFSGSGSSDSDGSITEYRWSFGDGTGYVYGKTVAHAYASAASYTATLRVTDDDGATDSDTASVQVTSPPPPPPPTPSGYFTINGQQATGTLSFVDPNLIFEFVATASPDAVTRVQVKAWVGSTLQVDVNLDKVDSTHWRKTVTLPDGVFNVEGYVYSASGSTQLLSIIAGVGEDESEPWISPRIGGTLLGAAVFGVGATIRLRQPKRRRR